MAVFDLQKFKGRPFALNYPDIPSLDTALTLAREVPRMAGVDKEFLIERQPNHKFGLWFKA